MYFFINQNKSHDIYVIDSVQMQWYVMLQAITSRRQRMGG